MSDEGKIIDGLLRDAEDALARGSIDKARGLYQGILANQPNNGVALRQLGAIEANGGSPALALDLFERCKSTGPLDADLCHAMATAFRLMGRPKLAHSALNAALGIDPRHGPSLYDSAVDLQRRGKYEAARKIYAQLASVGAGHFDTLFNHGVVLYRLGDLVAAERWFHAAAHVDATSPRPFINLAMIYRVWGFLREAVACLEHAITLAPDNADARWNLASALLVSGDFARGFAAYEARFLRPGRGERPMALPRWKGEALAGQTILITLEQGMGDAIHFARFIQGVADRGGRVVVECRPGLERLLATAPGVAATVGPGSVVPAAAYYAPLMSLPHLLGTTLESVPATVPYLAVPPGTPPFALAGTGLRVGLVWRGNPQHEHDQWRSMALATLAPLFDVKDVQYFSLQVGEGAAECAAVPGITDLSPRLTDFAATAAAVTALDLVIAVDTAVAHLAGALAKPVWLLIPQGNDWRWLHDRADSPWYPTARLFRQRRQRNWRPAVRAMAEALTALAADRAKLAPASVP